MKPKDLAKAIRGQREFLGMTQVELARACEVSGSVIGRAEKWGKMTTTTFLKICDGLGLMPSEVWAMAEGD